LIYVYILLTLREKNHYISIIIFHVEDSVKMVQSTKFIQIQSSTNPDACILEAEELFRHFLVENLENARESNIWFQSINFFKWNNFISSTINIPDYCVLSILEFRFNFFCSASLIFLRLLFLTNIFQRSLANRNLLGR
jgi:hypothetical protein